MCPICLILPMLHPSSASWIEQTWLNHPFLVTITQHHLCHFNQKLKITMPVINLNNLSHCPQTIIHLLMVWLNDIFLLTSVNVCSTALPCDEDGTPFLDPKTSPVIQRQQSDNWTPYRSRIAFELADFLYHCEQMSAGNINILLVTIFLILFCLPMSFHYF